MTSRRKVVIAGAALAAVVIAAALLLRRDTSSLDPKSAASAADPRTGALRVPGKQGAAAAPRQPVRDGDPIGPLVLEGQVVDAADQPVAGATVYLGSRPLRTAITEGDGSFSFDGLLPRSYVLAAVRDGEIGGPIDHALGAHSDPAWIRLHPGATLEVTVVGADGGAPIAGAEVKLGALAPLAATTDRDGVARLRGVDEGHASVEARAAGHATGFASVLVPAAPGGAAAQIELTAGASVSGLVVDPDGAPVAGARVSAVNTAEPFARPRRDDEETTDGAGRFTLRAVGAGETRVRAAHPDHGTGSSAPFAVDGVRPATDVRVQLTAGARIAGRVVDAAGAPAPWATLALGPGTDALDFGRGPAQFYADAEGAFERGDLERVPTTIVASTDEATSEMIEVDLATTPEERDLVLVLAVAGRIGGVVVDSSGAPVPGATVRVMPDSSAELPTPPLLLRGAPPAQTDGDGRFLIGGLPDGSYQLSAARPGRPSAASWPEPMLSARPGDLAVRLVVPGAGRIRGRVRYASGRWPTSFRVTLDHSLPRSISSPDGSFELRDVVPGRHELTVSGPDFADTGVGHLEVVEGGERDVGTIRLDRGRSVSGRVLDASGQPVAGAAVVVSNMVMGDGRGLPGSLGAIFGDQTGRRAIADSAGRYTVTGLDRANTLVVVAEHARGRSRGARLEPGDTDETVDLKIREVGGIDGIVTNRGRPVRVQVMAILGAQRDQQFGVESGEDGVFRFERLTPGDYHVEPGATRRERRWPVQVEPGKRARVAIELAAGDITLTVVVTPRGPGTIDLAQVILFPAGVAPTNAAEVRVLRVAPGHGDVRAQMTSGGEARLPNVVPGSYSVCVLPIPAPSADEDIIKRVSENREKYKVHCLPYAAAYAPLEQRFTASVPPAEPVE